MKLNGKSPSVLFSMFALRVLFSPASVFLNLNLILVMF